MVLENVVVPQDLAKDPGGLFDDRRIRNDVHHPLEAPLLRLHQPKGQRGNRLSPARGHGQRVEIRRAPLPLANAGFKNRAAPRVERALRRKPSGDISLQPRPELVDRICAGRIPTTPIHELPRVGVVRVHQARKQHPGEEHSLQLVLHGIRGAHCVGQRQLRLPRAVVLQLALLGPVYPAPERAGARPVAPATPVRKPAVVAGHRERGKGLSSLHAFKRPGRAVIHLRALLEQPPLKGGRVLSEVVRQPGQFALFPSAKVPGMACAAPCRALQMLQYGLLPSILGHMRQPCGFRHAISPVSLIYSFLYHQL